MESLTFHHATSWGGGKERSSISTKYLLTIKSDIPEITADRSFTDARRKSTLSIEDMKLIHDMYK